jgi:hypothetical protein
LAQVGFSLLLASEVTPNTTLEKADRPAHRVIPKSRFAKLDTNRNVIQGLMRSNKIDGQGLTNSSPIDQSLRGSLSEKSGGRLDALGSPWARYASRRHLERVGILCICCFGCHEGRSQTEMF